MSQAYEELNEVLSDPDYWEVDGFIDTPELIAELDDQDWNDLADSWSRRSQEWRDNFHVSGGPITPGRIRLAFSLLGSDDPSFVSDGYRILMNMGMLQQNNVSLSEQELEAVARIWQTHPEWRGPLQYVAAHGGGSGLLSPMLAREEWREG